jgi:glycosyltransferase involved in cell wall biosynthesis
MPKVSVIIPTYNCAHYVAQAVESALSQTYRDLEVIVLDDGSVDKTAEVMQRYEGKVKYIRQENSGLPAARNRAIEASSGEFIALLDADDWWEPHKLSEQVPMLEQDPEICLVYSDLEVVYDDGKIISSFLSSRPLATDGYVFDRLLHSGFIIPSTVLLRRTHFEEAGMFDESMRSHEDIDLWLRMCQRWKVALVRKPLTHRRQGATNMTSNDSLRSEYNVKLFEKALSLPNLSGEQRRTMITRLGSMYFLRGYYYFSKGSMPECRSSLVQSIRCGVWRNTTLYFIASFLPVSLIEVIRSKKSRVNISEA